MSTQMHLLFPRPLREAFETPPPPQPRLISESAWDPGRFAREELRRLIRQIFFPGWPRPARHVAFVAMEDETDTESICMQVGQILSSEIQANTCIVEANRREVEQGSGWEITDAFAGREKTSMRGRARRLSSRLWSLPQRDFLEGCGAGPSAIQLESRLEKLGLDFDFTLLHLPPVNRLSEALLLGHLSDGVVLIVEAHSTRRVKAQRAREILQNGNVKVLGTVLNGRRFPIPEGIYRRL